MTRQATNAVAALWPQKKEIDKNCGIQKHAPRPHARISVRDFLDRVRDPNVRSLRGRRAPAGGRRDRVHRDHVRRAIPRETRKAIRRLPRVGLSRTMP